VGRAGAALEARGTTVLAHALAMPVLARVGAGAAAGVVRGVGRDAAYVDFDGFVVAVTAPGVPLMPNGIALGSRPDALPWAHSGTPVSLGCGALGAGESSVVWDAERPRVWDPRLRPGAPASPGAVRARGAAILAACGIAAVCEVAALADNVGAGLEAAGRTGVARLLGSVAARDPVLASDAAELLIGRGPGLTPEGDDVIAATAGVLGALAVVAGWSEGELRAWRGAVLAPGLAARTTSLSATLVELAGGGDVIEPVHGLVDLRGDGRARAALRRLLGIGGSTGRAYATAAGAVALVLGAA
jgi:hypothetical protein